MLSFQAWKQSIWWLSACCAKSWQENRNRPSYLGAYERYSHATPNVKTHAAGEYTNTHGGRFDGGGRAKTQPRRRRERERGLIPACSRAARALHSLNGWNGQLLIKQTHTHTKKKASTRSNQSPTATTNLQNLSRIYRACRAAHRQDATNAKPRRSVRRAQVRLNDPVSTSMTELD